MLCDGPFRLLLREEKCGTSFNKIKCRKYIQFLLIFEWGVSLLDREMAEQNWQESREMTQHGAPVGFVSIRNIIRCEYYAHTINTNKCTDIEVQNSVKLMGKYSDGAMVQSFGSKHFTLYCVIYPHVIREIVFFIHISGPIIECI